MVDQTRRKLHIPNWFSPYLEKHRIYELFHEMARELVVQQPPDHVLFLKEILYNAAVSRYAPRIIFIAPPHVNTFELAKCLSEKCRASVVTEQDILANMSKQNGIRPRARRLSNALREVLRSDNTYYTGWILPDYPSSRKEALSMQHEGILPTHVFQIIPPFAPDLLQLKYDKNCDIWYKYRRTILGIREAFKSNLKEIHVGGKNLLQVADICLELVNIKKRFKAPVIPRICMIGPRGSGRKTQAKKIAQTFNLIHVDFEYLLCQAWISETYLGSLLRECKDKVGEHALLLTSIVHKRILELDCIERGWILTGFPNTVEDFKNLDMIDTPPNRVIFLECDFNICRERITNRRMNCYSGSVINILENMMNKNDPEYKTHPKDIEELFNSEIKYYCENYEDMRKYCGCTSAIVDASQVKQWVTENIEAIVMRPLPDCEPRTPCPSMIITDGSDDQDPDNDLHSLSVDSCMCSPCAPPPPQNVKPPKYSVID